MSNPLIDILRRHIFDIYPSEMSSGDVERFAREQGYLGETGRKRMADLRDDGYVETRWEAIKKQDGKTTKVSFHRAVPERADEIYKPRYEYLYDEAKGAMVERRIETIPEKLKTTPHSS